MTTELSTLPPDTFLADLLPPPDPSTLERIFGDYVIDRRALKEVDSALSREDLLAHFLDTERYSRYQLRDLKGAIASLDAQYWGRIFAASQIEPYMPAARIREWHEQIRDLNTPPFDPPTVRATLADLFSSRLRFFAERVDGVFRALSPQHLTNRPQGFGRRLIIADVRSLHCSHVGTINDLRRVVAMLLGRESPEWRDTDWILNQADRRSGQWLEIDGGAMRIRTYLKGTAHIEISPEIAWRLNAVLAYLHPTAIPAEHRRRPPAKKREKPSRLFTRPIPREVLRRLADLEILGDSVRWRVYWPNNPVQKEADRTLEALGFTLEDSTATLQGATWREIEPLLGELIALGTLPDQRAYEFYPTPPDIAARMVGALGLEAGMRVLEPSAGQGHLALALPRGIEATAVEIDPVFAGVLRARVPHLTVECADFLKWEAKAPFDRILMNPPFSRAEEFLSRAAGFLRSGGRIVALLPASMQRRPLPLEGFEGTEWSEPLDFPGVSIKVAILTLHKKEQDA